MDSVLVSFVFSLWIINEFEKDKETNDFNGTKHGQKCQKVGGNQLAILPAWPRIGIWIRDNREQIQPAVRAGLELGVSEIQVRRSNSSEWENYSFVSNRYVSQGLYQSMLYTLKNCCANKFSKTTIDCNPLQSSSSLSICSSSFPFSVFSIPSFNVLGGYFPSYHLVWWQFPLLECWQISPVTQFSPLSHPWNYVVLFNWMRCTLFSPSIGVKFELSQVDNPSFNFDLQT